MAQEHIWLSDRWRLAERPGWLIASARWLARQTDLQWHQTISSSRDTGAQPVETAPGSASEAEEFEAFVRRFERQILNYLWRMTGEEQSAYDLTQEVFLRAWRHFSSISQYEQPQAWLFRVATNLALTHNSSRKRQAAPMSALPNDAPGASDPARHFAESEVVRQVLLQLPSRRRAALVLREVYGLSTAEVGKVLGMSETAVRMAISRAREQFRALYREGEGLA
ncbi:MAG TPA: sigma-70 family RNA polymerase sigma factor [Ktedonobacterales bacterium]|jgi:RNA polymerase sigma-70 factor, ECF subfamily|nr:sigma-70 family RNA polymerase sigma factor [Ktedonobacterales bacterium]